MHRERQLRIHLAPVAAVVPTARLIGEHGADVAARREMLH